MGNNSVPKFIFLLSRFLVNRESVLGRFYCILYYIFYFMYTYNLTKTNEISFNTDLLVIAYYTYMYSVTL